ncbi:MAG: NADPH-dependent glutamate synthase [Promethearchaeota archaeon]|nr:MAG: NADPH-dependent glutamate synthase [Candidatus Lokiarchaeota archaeon]
MIEQTPLIEVFLKNKDIILQQGRYDELEFNNLLNSIKDAEKERQNILKKIKEIGSLDLQRLKNELEIPEKNLIFNIEYLRELGSLEFLGEKSRFFHKFIEDNENKGLFPNVSIIRDKNICSGCGLCDSICPVHAINYTSHTFEIDEDLCFNCGLCFSCCPRSFFPKTLKKYQESNEVDIKNMDELNHYYNIYSAQTNDDRIKNVAQNGGIVTTLLKTAFQEKIIDATLAVSVSDEPHKPLPVLIDQEEELLRTAGTKYTNSPSLKLLHSSKIYKNIAIVGTPCMMEALKKISFYPLNKPFYDNIALKIGLFCMESFDYEQIKNLLKTEFQISPNVVKKMDIDKGRFYAFHKDQSIFTIPVKKLKTYGRLGCFFCDDLTSEQADISVGSIGSELGWSTVIIRTKKGAELFQKALNLQLIKKKDIREESESFSTLSRVSKSKQKIFKETRRPKMIEQEPNIRATNFQEVPKGLTLEMVKLESKRCLQCGDPHCVSGCPVNIDIPRFLRLLRGEKFIDALRVMKDNNLLPAICGRVCPQETQCEEVCLLNYLEEPIAIGYLERFIADWERENQLKECPECKPPNNIKVAVIGSGPAGLTCAGELAKKGYDVTIFEAFHAGGGVLTYGIPEFRLPKEIVKDEIETLKMLDVKIKFNTIIGKTLTIQDLKDMEYEAFFIGVGAGLPMFPKIPGLSLNGVLTANEFLTRANLMKAYRFPEYDTPIKIGEIVIIIGGGNTALDASRVAKRLGAKRVIVAYRRSELEMPARREEYHHAIEEGIEFHFLTSPLRFIGDENDNVTQIQAIKMRLGKPDESGRRRPIPIEGSEYLIEADTVILGIGANANPILTKSLPDLKLTKWGYIETDENSRTNIEGVYAGGDIVSGSATVISAMGAGKRAAHAIHQYLKNKFALIEK